MTESNRQKWHVNNKSANNISRLASAMIEAKRDYDNGIVILRDSVGAPEEAVYNYAEEAFVLLKK